MKKEMIENNEILLRLNDDLTKFLKIKCLLSGITIEQQIENFIENEFNLARESLIMLEN